MLFSTFKTASVRVTLTALALAATASLGGCGSTDSTSGKRVSLETVAQVDPELESTFTTAVGWKVHLDKAAVAVGSLYYFDGEPAFVQLAPPPRRNSLQRFLGFFAEGVAHAHPGHYVAGNALGQMLESGSVDLFDTPAPLGTGDGVTGTFRSARFTFAETPSGSAAKELDGHVAFTEGTAVKVVKAGEAEPETIHFQLFADFADVAKSVTHGEVDGCAFSTAEVEGDGTVTLTFKPSIWFDLVDFSKVDPGSADAPTVIERGDIAQIGFALGLAQLTAYNFSFSK